MARPRVIVADTDMNYILPLQLKFAKDFFDKIDLEIITEAEYFQRLFLEAQKADLLLVSDRLYDETLQRHDITNIFVMTEQYEAEESTGGRNVTRIFKYTSIKEIFNVIVSKSMEILTGTAISKKASQIVLVCSACGGTGKTTVALGVSACLTLNYKKVLYLNADRMQTFQYGLENDAPIMENDVYTKLSEPSENVYNEIKHVVRKELFSYLPPFKAALMSLGLSYSVFGIIAKSAKHTGEYDYVVIDADTVFDEEKAELIQMADRVIVVTTQRKSSVYATNVLVSNVNGMNDEKYIFICNDFKKEEYNALVSEDVPMKFSVSDYIEHIYDYDSMKCGDFSNILGIQKTAFLVL